MNFKGDLARWRSGALKVELMKVAELDTELATLRARAKIASAARSVIINRVVSRSRQREKAAKAKAQRVCDDAPAIRKINETIFPEKEMPL